MESRRAEAEALLNDGLTVTEAAREMRVNRATLYSALVRWGIAADATIVDNIRRQRDGRLASITDEQYRELVSVFGVREACKVMGITPSTLKEVLDDRGIVPAKHTPRGRRLERRVKELETEAAHVVELAERIEAAAAQAPPLPAVRVEPVRADGPLNDSPVDVVLHVSDLQYGERVDPDEVTGGNYSPEVFQAERLPRWLEAASAVIRGTAAQHPIETVWVVQGGDFVEGEGVFGGQHWHLAMDAGEQVATLAPQWANALRAIGTLAKESGASRVVVCSVVGNHGVVGGRKAGAVPASLNLDFLTYRMIGSLLEGSADNPVDLYHDGPAKSVYFQPAGWLWLATHGDQDRGGGLVGVPVVTGSRNDLTLRVQTGMHHNVHLVGHFHRPTQVTIGGSDKKVWNGDWCGANNLSTGRGGGSLPTQRAYVVHGKWGLIQTWDLYLTAHGGTGAEVLTSDGWQ